MTVILLQAKGNELYLTRQGESVAYLIGCAPKTSFDVDAEMLASGRNTGWDYPAVPLDKLEAEPVATWEDGKVEVRQMGRAAQIYLEVSPGELDLLPSAPDYIDRAELRSLAAVDQA
jgi:hypothetical protein